MHPIHICMEKGILGFTPQNTVDEVQMLIRKHEDFEATTQAHDERIKQLSEQANRLIHGGHYDIPRLVVRKCQSFKTFAHQYISCNRHIHLLYLCMRNVCFRSQSLVQNC